MLEARRGPLPAALALLACSAVLALGAGWAASALGAEAAVSRSQTASEDGVSAVLTFLEEDWLHVMHC